MKELNSLELSEVNGGATLAYRLGQILRGAYMSAGNIKGYFDFMAEAIENEMIANSK